MTPSNWIAQTLAHRGKWVAPYFQYQDDGYQNTMVVLINHIYFNTSTQKKQDYFIF